jgi:hypothetical protein
LVFASLYRIAPGVVNENGAETEVNAGLVELINDAFAIRNQFLSGSHDSIEAGPEIVRALLAGSQSSADAEPAAAAE